MSVIPDKPNVPFVAVTAAKLPILQTSGASFGSVVARPRAQAPARWLAGVPRRHASGVEGKPQALKGSFSPGRGQRHLNNFPVLEQVTHASRMSGPPKQRFVVIGSGNGMNS